MKTRRMVVMVAGVLAAGSFVGLLAGAALKPAPVVVAGGLDSGRFAYRVWSDGRVEVNDVADQIWNDPPKFAGWQTAK